MAGSQDENHSTSGAYATSDSPKLPMRNDDELKEIEAAIVAHNGLPALSEKLDHWTYPGGNYALPDTRIEKRLNQMVKAWLFNNMMAKALDKILLEGYALMRYSTYMDLLGFIEDLWMEEP
ncbi:hypothetical protein EJ06DRAFT_547569 [Trichodelitschia bisporula]|uniref:Uncharacterized protein n=1 Tax=Trichodelitschia bisporula TaxID=703511 RepID=A0A6G1I252_9PEZI|nr:hypothetical protein EJ06DRAFT_547569 [Trichodelitschia bisporula]